MTQLVAALLLHKGTLPSASVGRGEKSYIFLVVWCGRNSSCTQAVAVLYLIFVVSKMGGRHSLSKVCDSVAYNNHNNHKTLHCHLKWQFCNNSNANLSGDNHPVTYVASILIEHKHWTKILLRDCWHIFRLARVPGL